MLGQTFTIAPYENDAGLVVPLCAAKTGRIPGQPVLERLALGPFELGAFYARGCQYIPEAVGTRPGRPITREVSRTRQYSGCASPYR